MLSDEATAAETFSNHTDVKPADDDDAICCLEFLSSFPNVSFQKNSFNSSQVGKHIWQ